MADESGFGGRAVVSFESRRTAEMASLIERHGGAPVAAPTVREVALDGGEAALAFARRLARDGFDAVVLMTGVGTRALVEEVAAEIDRPALAAALSRVAVVARGPKPAAALRALGVTGFATVPEPNTWREVHAALVAAGPLAGRRIAVQEHGAPSLDLNAALREAGAEVTPVPVYRWALPEDTGPLRAALHAVAGRRVTIALFTSRVQVDNAFAVAGEEGIAAEVRAALAAGVVGSVGPVCTEALVAEGLAPDVQPEHPRMGPLVKETAARAAAILAAKAARGAS